MVGSNVNHERVEGIAKEGASTSVIAVILWVAYYAQPMTYLPNHDALVSGKSER
jgi:hypothetical protein